MGPVSYVDQRTTGSHSTDFRHETYRVQRNRYRRSALLQRQEIYARGRKES